MAQLSGFLPKPRTFWQTSFPPAPASGPPETNLEWWFKADEITGLNDGDKISTWPDSSVNGRDATQGNNTFRFTYKTGIVNGLPVARCVGNLEEGMLISAFTANVPNTSLYYVVDPTLLTSQRSIVTANPSTADLVNVYTQESAPGVFRHRFDYNGISLGSAIAVATLQLIGWIVDDPGDTFSLYRNGALLESDVGIDPPLSASDWAIGAGDGSLRCFAGDICEVMYYSVAHDEATRQEVEDYLNAKWVVF